LFPQEGRRSMPPGLVDCSRENPKKIVAKLTNLKLYLTHFKTTETRA